MLLLDILLWLFFRHGFCCIAAPLYHAILDNFTLLDLLVCIHVSLRQVDFLLCSLAWWAKLVLLKVEAMLDRSSRVLRTQLVLNWRVQIALRWDVQKDRRWLLKRCCLLHYCHCRWVFTWAVYHDAVQVRRHVGCYLISLYSLHLCELSDRGYLLKLWIVIAAIDSRLSLAYQKLSLQLITNGLEIPQLLLHILPLNDLLIASWVINRCKIGEWVLPLLAVFLRFML